MEIWFDRQIFSGTEGGTGSPKTTFPENGVFAGNFSLRHGLVTLAFA